jgi:deoxyribose-phosphate aldolase
MQFTYEQLAKTIDHSLLMPTMPVEQLEAGCRLALDYNVASVCIMPYYMKRCTEILSGSTVMPSTTIGFPHGGHTTKIKRAEAEQAIADGCQELDMVVNISQVLSGNWDYVTADIRTVVEASHAAGRKVKVIFENCYLNDDQKKKLCEICTNLKADWVKTSTGYGTGGATIPDLQLMLDNVGPGIQVKAAGGVRDLETFVQVKAMGVTRIGSSRTSEILEAARQQLNLKPIAQKVATTAGY